MSKGKDNIYGELGKLRGRISNLETARDRKIMKELGMIKPGLDAYAYTYSEIAHLNAVSYSYVQRIAVKNNLARG